MWAISAISPSRLQTMFREINEILTFNWKVMSLHNAAAKSLLDQMEQRKSKVLGTE